MSAFRLKILWFIIFESTKSVSLPMSVSNVDELCIFATLWQISECIYLQMTLWVLSYRLLKVNHKNNQSLMFIFLTLILFQSWLQLEMIGINKISSSVDTCETYRLWQICCDEVFSLLYIRAQAIWWHICNTYTNTPTYFLYTFLYLPFVGPTISVL